MKIVYICTDACEDPLHSLPSIRSMKCYSCVCVKGEFPKCQGKNLNIFVYIYVIFLFLFRTIKCCVLMFFFSLLLHYFENTVSRQSVEKDFVQNFIIIYYVQIEWKVNKSFSFSFTIRKYSFVLHYKTCIVKITKFYPFINFVDVTVFSFKSLCNNEEQIYSIEHIKKSKNSIICSFY